MNNDPTRDSERTPPALFETTLLTAHLLEAGIARCRFKVERIGEAEGRAVVTELERAATASAGRVVLDMDSVMMLLSAGIGAIISAHKLCQSKKGRLVLYNLQPEIKEMLHLTGLPKVLTIKEDEARALKAAM